MLLCRLLGMASPFPRDNLTRGLARDADGRVLVNLDESSPWDREATDNDQATRGLLRDASGAILARVTGLPPSVASKTESQAVVVYSGSAYPARPSGYESVQYIGPVQPSSWQPGDLWLKTVA